MYSYQFQKDVVVGKARLEDIDASAKDLCEVCANIRGKKLAAALSLLEKACTGELPILYRKYTSGLAHRHELGGKPGRYPKKAAKFVLAALQSALGSAKAKGLSEDLIVVHAAANKKTVFPRLAAKGGRRSRSYFETARVEIVVKERVPGKKPVKKEAKAEAKIEAKAESKPAANPEPKPEAKPPLVEKKIEEPKPATTKADAGSRKQETVSRPAKRS